MRFFDHQNTLYPYCLLKFSSKKSSCLCPELFPAEVWGMCWVWGLTDPLEQAGSLQKRSKRRSWRFFVSCKATVMTCTHLK